MRALFILALAAVPYGYFLTGSGADVHTRTHPGFALVGGGKDLDEVYRWLIAKSGGGDFVVIRASGANAYNDYLDKLGRLDSVETLVIPNNAAAHDEFVARKIRGSEALFIAGGDQWNYIRVWSRSPVADAVQSLIDRGIPVGGTSAGLAVLGEYIFTAAEDTVTSSQALADPFDKHVTIGTNFLHIPLLRRTITDSHFRQRDRMGRTLVFLARMLHDDKLPEARAIAIDERTAALIEPDGSLQVAGFGNVYFLRARQQAPIIEPGKPLSLAGVEVWRAGSGGHFDLRQWRATGGSRYELRVQAGRVISSQTGGAIY